MRLVRQRHISIKHQLVILGTVLGIMEPFGSRCTSRSVMVSIVTRGSYSNEPVILSLPCAYLRSVSDTVPYTLDSPSLGYSKPSVQPSRPGVTTMLKPTCAARWWYWRFQCAADRQCHPFSEPLCQCSRA